MGRTRRYVRCGSRAADLRARLSVQDNPHLVSKGGKGRGISSTCDDCEPSDWHGCRYACTEPGCPCTPCPQVHLRRNRCRPFSSCVLRLYRRCRLRRVGSSSSFRLSSSYLHSSPSIQSPVSSVVGSLESAQWPARGQAATQEKPSTRWPPFPPKRNETRCANILARSQPSLKNFNNASLLGSF